MQRQLRACSASFWTRRGNFVDMADIYGDGRSEEITSQAIQGQRDQVVLATNLRHAKGDPSSATGLSRRHILASNAPPSAIGGSWTWRARVQKPETRPTSG
jgi:aryl-alcohol dehydrogenase-like predicted oxidoreductase